MVGLILLRKLNDMEPIRKTVEDVIASQLKFDPFKEERVRVNVRSDHQLSHLNGMEGCIVPHPLSGRMPYVDFGVPVTGRILYEDSNKGTEPGTDAEGYRTPGCCVPIFEDELERIEQCPTTKKHTKP